MGMQRCCRLGTDGYWGRTCTSCGDNVSSWSPCDVQKILYGALEKEIASKWWVTLEEKMREAAEEEKKLAVERGSFHDGVPAITVIVDGGWCKRTHKHSYNAKSGVGIIIGKETGKLLYMGVRNKYCSTCARADKENQPPQEHDCYKNWDGPSESMETDIILQGFKEAETKYGLRYTTFIGDGDSSLHPNLISGVLGWGHVITKSECANHAMKCYRASLERLVEEKTRYKGKGKLTESMRKKLTKAARCAIKMRSVHSNKAEAVKLLCEDLQNGPYHCFGDHSRCSTDYCKVKKIAQQQSSEHVQSENANSTTLTENDTDTDTAIRDIAQQEQRLWQDAVNEENLENVRHTTSVPQDIDKEMMCDIQRLVGRLIAKSEQLLGKSMIDSVSSHM